MINLYELLALRPDATEAEIRAAVRALSAAGAIDPKATQAVHEWLLVKEVRQRYDAKLRLEQPEWFAGFAEQSESPESEPAVMMPSSHRQPGKAAAGRSKYRIGGSHKTRTRQGGSQQPYLWNPKAVVLWALFLSPLAVWLHAENWEELGEPQKAKKNRFFVFLVIGFVLGTTLITIITGIRIPLYASTLLWLGWFLTMGREQMDFVRSTFGEDYERRPWGKALGLVVLAIVGLIFAGVILALLAQIAGVVHPSLTE